MKNKMNYSNGFTLIELLVVVLIIGILAAIALPQYNRAVAKSRFSEAITALESIKRAQIMCYMEDPSAKCNELDNLSIDFPRRMGPRTFRTDNFIISGSNCGGLSSAGPAALYLRENVCLCYVRNALNGQRYEDMTLGIAVNGNNQHGLPNATMDYPKLLNVPQVAYNSMEGCCCEGFEDSDDPEDPE